jgi:hypothetical protein
LLYSKQARLKLLACARRLILRQGEEVRKRTDKI